MAKLCLCGAEALIAGMCAECAIDLDRTADILERRPDHPYNGPMGIFEDYDGCDSEERTRK